jgi:ParB/RepB/Spo0J family partition protein
MDQLVRKSKHWLKVSRPNRTHNDEAALLRLGASMKANGQQQAINCLANGTIISGERRWRAAMLTDGLDEVWVRIIDDPLDAKQIRVLRITENLHRLDITPWEKYLECQGFREDDPAMTARDMADALCLDPSTITRYLSPNDCIEAVREQLRLGAIGIKACYEISKAAPEDQPALLARALGGSAEDVAREGRKRRNGTAAVRTDRIRIDQSTGTTITVKGDGLDLESIVESLAAAVKEGRKALADGLDAKTWAAVCRDRAKAGA